MPADFAPLRAAAPAAPAPLMGGRWARALGGALLAGLALLTGARWLGPGAAHSLPGGGRERIVQQPVGPNDFSPDRPEATAPDPGDDL